VGIAKETSQIAAGVKTARSVAHRITGIKAGSIETTTTKTQSSIRKNENNMHLMARIIATDLTSTNQVRQELYWTCQEILTKQSI
jgi:hypothetical protein